MSEELNEMIEGDALIFFGQSEMLKSSLDDQFTNPDEEREKPFEEEMSFIRTMEDIFMKMYKENKALKKAREEKQLIINEVIEKYDILKERLQSFNKDLIPTTRE